jgi:hypothetical protein
MRHPRPSVASQRRRATSPGSSIAPWSLAQHRSPAWIGPPASPGPKVGRKPDAFPRWQVGPLLDEVLGVHLATMRAGNAAFAARVPDDVEGALHYIVDAVGTSMRNDRGVDPLMPKTSVRCGNLRG